MRRRGVRTREVTTTLYPLVDKEALDVHVLGGQIEILPSTAAVPNIVNIDCAVINQEYSYALPAGCRRFLLRARKSSKVLFTYSTGAADQLTISPGANFEDANFYSSQTIYFRCSKADEIIEIVTYT